jgi:hypothetical protein
MSNSIKSWLNQQPVNLEELTEEINKFSPNGENYKYTFAIGWCIGQQTMPAKGKEWKFYSEEQSESLQGIVDAFISKWGGLSTRHMQLEGFSNEPYLVVTEKYCDYKGDYGRTLYWDKSEGEEKITALCKKAKLYKIKDMAGNVIEKNLYFSTAQSMLARFEADDMANDCFVPDFYEIVEMETEEN